MTFPTSREAEAKYHVTKQGGSMSTFIADTQVYAELHYEDGKLVKVVVNQDLDTEFVFCIAIGDRSQREDDDKIVSDDGTVSTDPDPEFEAAWQTVSNTTAEQASDPAIPWELFRR